GPDVFEDGFGLQLKSSDLMQDLQLHHGHR
ncbi:MAG: hypothetical protein K0R83_2429, partial [Caulobacter sp.]|nr:hypothetical protein [Caulobacter sp.]